MIKIYEVYCYNDDTHEEENDSFWLRKENAIKRVEELRSIYKKEHPFNEFEYVEHELSDTDGIYLKEIPVIKGEFKYEHE